MFCKHCGTELKDESKFCHSCGKTLNNHSELKRDNSTPSHSHTKKKMGADEIVVIIFVVIFLLAIVVYFTIYPKYYPQIKNLLQNLNQRDQINQLTKKVDKLSSPQTPKVQNVQKTQPQNITISATELDPYLTGVVNIICGDLSGSGTLQKFSNQYYVLTNFHILENLTDSCEIIVNAQDNKPIGMYLSDPTKSMIWNNKTDIIALKIGIKKPIINGGVDYTEKSRDIDKLNYKISDLPHCSVNTPVGTPMVVIGYPAYGIIKSTLEGYPIELSVRVVSNGIISGFDSTVKDTQKLPYSNYFVSAKIDSGNSGGIAFSKTGKDICVLGVPTWLSMGNYETQGLVQNIHNIFKNH